MAIKVGGTSIISDDKNISNVGIVTIGGSTSGTLEVGNNTGTGVTATGDGTLSIAGTFYAFDVVTPLKIDSFSPSDGSINNPITTDIRITFNQAIGIGSTGFVRIKTGSGTVQDVYGVGSTYISRADLNKTLVITPSSSFAKGNPGAANTITTIVDASFIDDPAFTGINTEGSNITYGFETEVVNLGDAYEGGYLICVAGGVQWIVAPSTTEVSRNFGNRNDAVTTAQANAACGNWFVPTVGELSNPGYTCRTYWDSYASATYWSSTLQSAPRAFCVNFVTGASGPTYSTATHCVRAFRCVTY